jgi:hypothetical protein
MSKKLCKYYQASNSLVSPNSLPLALEQYVLRHYLMMIISKSQISQRFEWL